MSRIINFTEAASIALHGMVLIAKSGDLMNVIKISEATSSSKHHVAKIMQRLVKEGYLNSYRGPSGGFSLKIEPENITLLEIFESIEGKIEVTDCPLDHPICPFDKCIFKNIARTMTLDFVDYMKTETLDRYI